MLCLDNDGRSGSASLIDDGLGDLLGQILLNLHAAREYIHDASDLGQPDYFALGNIGHVAFADKGQHMVLAHGVQFDVLHDHHLFRAGREEGVIDDFVDILAIAAHEKFHGFRGAFRGIREPWATEVFTDRCDDIVIGFFNYLCHGKSI